MCMGMFAAPQNKVPDKRPPESAADVPLGDGMADAAKNSILSRRSRIERALEDMGE